MQVALNLKKGSPPFWVTGQAAPYDALNQVRPSVPLPLKLFAPVCRVHIGLNPPGCPLSMGCGFAPPIPWY